MVRSGDDRPCRNALLCISQWLERLAIGYTGILSGLGSTIRCHRRFVIILPGSLPTIGVGSGDHYLGARLDTRKPPGHVLEFMDAGRFAAGAFLSCPSSCRSGMDAGA